MTGTVREAYSFDDVPTVSELNGTIVFAPDASSAWNGSAAAIVPGWNGSGQAIDGPNNLTASRAAWDSPSMGVRFRWKLKTVGATNLIAQLQGTGGTSASLQANSSNFLELDDVRANGQLETSTTPIAAGTWYETEFWWYLHDTAGQWRVYHDGQEIGSLTGSGVDTMVVGGSTLRGIRFHNPNIVVDEVVILTSAGAFASTDFLVQPGVEAHIVDKVISGDGFYQQFVDVNNTGPGLWGEVDEQLSGTAANYLDDWLNATALDDRVSFVYDALDPIALGITKIISVRSQFQHTAPDSFKHHVPFLRIGGVNYEGVAGGFGFAPNKTVDIWQTDPSTATTWESQPVATALATIDSLELGMRHDSSGSFTRLSHVAFSVLYVTIQDCSTGIILRGLFQNDAEIDRGYVVRLVYSGAFITAMVERYSSGVAMTLATADVTTGYGLTDNVDYKLLASAENVNGTGPADGTPSLTLSINSQSVGGWVSSTGGVTIGSDDSVRDGSPGALLQGPAQGLYLIPPASGALYYKNWIEEASITPPDDDGEDEPSLPLNPECHGKIGTHAAPVGSTIEVQHRARVQEHRYESDHVQRVVLDNRQRREWRISMQAATLSERSALWTFWNAHGKSIPFDFAEPEDGQVVCAHFLDDSLETISLAPEPSSYEYVVQELLDANGSIAAVPGPSMLGVTRFSPVVLQPIIPATRSLTISIAQPSVAGKKFTPNVKVCRTTLFAPRLRLAIIPPMSALSIAKYEPTLTMKVAPPSASLILTTFAPTVP